MGQFSGTDGVGVIWWTREDYPRVLSIMTDAHKLPRSFDEWQKRANEALAFIEREGGKPIRVETNIDELLAYCVARDLDFDANGRSRFACDPANWPAHSKH